MRVLNKIKFDIFFLLILTLSLFFSIGIDFLIYDYVENIKNSRANIRLIEFFVKITQLGNSSWYFGMTIIFTLFLYFNKKIKIIRVKNIDVLINFFTSVFIYLIAIGFITQLLKHLIGRPRPNHTDFDSDIILNFLTFDSSFHSFPSGHSSTIFMISLILCVFLPKLKYLFLFLASVVALSRVVVGAHFFTDILAGAILALMVFKILNHLLAKKYSNLCLPEYVFKKNSELNYIIIIFIFIALFLTVGSDLDVYISGFFYYGNSQFALQSYDLLSKVVREGFLPLILIYVLILPIFANFFRINIIFFNYKFKIKEILLIWFSQIFVVLLFINLILKNFWGRVRPGEILDFGGVNPFTPWYSFSSACNTNCSFVSGDASVGFSIVILYFITKNIIFLYLSIFSGLLLGFVRIIAGGHFLSDILFAGMFVIFLNLVIFSLFKKYHDK